MGDILSTISKFLTHGVKTDCHIIFHYPFGHNYDVLVPALMESFAPTPYTITYEVKYSDFSVSLDKCVSIFGEEKHEVATNEADHTWWFSGKFHHTDRYYKFKTLWRGNTAGPIALALNHKDFNENHPIKEKFFSPHTNDALLKLVDNKNFFLLGDHRTFEENVDILSQCRYAVGIEGGWTHVTHSMRMPFIIAANERRVSSNIKVHPTHPRLHCVSTEDVFKYTDISVNPLTETQESLAFLLAQ